MAGAGAGRHTQGVILMHRIISAALATFALTAAFGSTAQAASVPPPPLQKNLQQLINHIKQDTTQTARDTQAYANQVAGPLRRSLLATVNRQVSGTYYAARNTTTSTTGTATKTTTRTTAAAKSEVSDTQAIANNVARKAAQRVANAYRALGIATFAVVDRTGHLVAGSNGVRVFTPAAGLWDIRWSTNMSGCVTVALDNTLTGPMLPIRQISTKEIRVLRRSSSASAGDSGFSVASFC